MLPSPRFDLHFVRQESVFGRQVYLHLAGEFGREFYTEIKGCLTTYYSDQQRDPQPQDGSVWLQVGHVGRQREFTGLAESEFDNDEIDLFGCEFDTFGRQRVRPRGVRRLADTTSSTMRVRQLGRRIMNSLNQPRVRLKYSSKLVDFSRNTISFSAEKLSSEKSETEV